MRELTTIKIEKSALEDLKIVSALTRMKQVEVLSEILKREKDTLLGVPNASHNDRTLR